VATFLDATNLGSRPYGGPGVSSHSGSPSVGARSLRFNGAQGGGPGNTAFGIENRPAFALPADFHFEGLVQFDAGTVGTTILIFAFIASPQMAVVRDGATGGLSLNFSGAETRRITGATAMNAGVLHAWAVTRVSGVCTLRLNGVSQGTYSNSDAFAANTIYMGGSGVIGGAAGLTGYMDEIALYTSNAGVTADYTPTYAEVPEGAANPHWESISVLIHGNGQVAESGTSLAGPLSLATFSPSYPAVQRVTLPTTRLDPLPVFGTRGLSGVVDYITTPAAGRIVRAYDKASGILLRETATAGDGTYSFPDLMGDRDYYVVALDSPPNPASAWDTDISPIVQAT
jgi:Concanavalin A-like lectin/glucanases superfamily